MAHSHDPDQRGEGLYFFSPVIVDDRACEGQRVQFIHRELGRSSHRRCRRVLSLLRLRGNDDPAKLGQLQAAAELDAACRTHA